MLITELINVIEKIKSSDVLNSDQWKLFWLGDQRKTPEDVKFFMSERSQPVKMSVKSRPGRGKLELVTDSKMAQAWLSLTDLTIGVSHLTDDAPKA